MKSFCYKEDYTKYWKWGTDIDAVKIGSPTINNGIVTNFTNSSYFILPKVFNPGSTPWEANIKITTGNNVNSQQGLIGDESDTYGTRMQIYQNHFLFYVSNGGGVWSVTVSGTYTVQPNTTYWLKYNFTGNSYTIKYSLDGINYILDGSVSTTFVTPNKTPSFGCLTRNSAAFLGSIDFNNTYFNINNVLWWHGTKADESTSSDYDYTTIASRYKLHTKDGKYSVIKE